MQGPEVKDAEAEVKSRQPGSPSSPARRWQAHRLAVVHRTRCLNAQYHGLTDKLYRVVERQQWKSDILSLKLALDVDERG